jgi:hypothetical protein
VVVDDEIPRRGGTDDEKQQERPQQSKRSSRDHTTVTIETMHVATIGSPEPIQRPQPLRRSVSTQIERPIAGAMIRSSAMSCSNCAGWSDCGPSLRAWSGS